MLARYCLKRQYEGAGVSLGILLLARHRQASMTQLPCVAGKIGQVLGRSRVLFSLCLDGSNDKFSLVVCASFCPDHSPLSLPTYRGDGVLSALCCITGPIFFPCSYCQGKNTTYPWTKTVTQASLCPLDCLNCLLKMKYIVCMDASIYD